MGRGEWDADASRVEEFPASIRVRDGWNRTGINRPCSYTKSVGLARQDEVLRMLARWFTFGRVAGAVRAGEGVEGDVGRGDREGSGIKSTVHEWDHDGESAHPYSFIRGQNSWTGSPRNGIKKAA